MSKIHWKIVNYAMVIGAAGLCLFALFSSAARFDMPIGYAGLYASMSKELAANNFWLPQSASFYGPGGIPFAYPPLGFYLMAFFEKMGISPFFYLRYAPPMLGAFGLLAFFGLSKTLFSSNRTALLATLLVSASPYLFESHIWAAGIVRGLAFGLFALTFWAFLTIKPGKNFHKTAALTGILAGLVALTHLAYVFFLALWIGLWIVLHPREKLWRALPAMLLGGLITVLPWVIVLANRYGLQVFFLAMNSHGTLQLMDVLGDPRQIYALIQMGLSKLFQIPLLAILAIVGAGYQVYKKKFDLAILFAVSTLFNIESRRFVIAAGILLAANLLSAFGNISGGKLRTLAGWTVIVLSAGFIYTSGINQIQRASPSITPLLLETTSFISTETPATSKYLFIADYNEAEWFPYLSQRTPIIAPWGGEWLDNLQEQTDLFYQSFACAQAQDTACLEDVITRSGENPDYLIVMKKKYRPFVDVLENSTDWKKLYNNREYQVWQRK